MRAFLGVFALLIAVSLLLPRWLDRPAPLAPPPQALSDAAMRALARMQGPSFDNDREYCGYLLRQPGGNLASGPVVAGSRDSCIAPMPVPPDLPVASLHTHGAYHRDVPAEFPTASDIETDIAEGTDGFIATPGGRLWYVSRRARAAMQLCGPECLPQDPDFRAGDDGWIDIRYTLQQLRAAEMPH